MDVGFRELSDNLEDIRNKQAVRRPFFMGASIPVPNGGMGRATLVCDQDADLWVCGLNATIVAPSDVNGRRLVTQATSWPITAPGGVAGVGYAERGITMRIFASSDKEDQLSDPLNFMDAKMLLQPGYRVGGYHKPYPFTRYMQRDSKLTFEFLNSDTVAGAYHFVTLVLTCKKYDPFTR